jgi:Galactose oxidase, central domain
MAILLWTQKQDIGPTPRNGHAMAYDSARGRVVPFGGEFGSEFTDLGIGVLKDTWEWDGENWTQVADTGPSARRGHTLASDDKRQRVVLFGGSRKTIRGPIQGQETDLQNDTWEWDGEKWTQVEDTGPTARSFHGMAYDNKRERTVLFGGTNDRTTPPQLNDTWEWDGSIWKHITDIGPGGVSGHTMVYNGRGIESFGGMDSSLRRLGNTWEWDGKHWTQKQDMGPDPCTFTSMAYDSKRDRVVLFGGFANDGPRKDTWEQFERPLQSS